MQAEIHKVICRRSLARIGRWQNRTPPARARSRCCRDGRWYIGPIDGLNPGGGIFGADRRFASGVRPNGAGDDTIVVVASKGRISTARFVRDPDLSPLDLLIAPNDSILVTSQHPFGALDAVTTVWECDPHDGHLLRVLSANGQTEFRRPRGLRFAPDGNLYCVARDEVIAFDFVSGACLGTIVRFPRLNGQALAFF